MKFATTWMLLATLGLGTVGCVSQERADDLQAAHRESLNEIRQLQQELEEKEATIASLQSQMGDDEALLEQLEQAQAERDRLREALSVAEEQLRQGGASMALPADLDSELQELAASNPELMSYDSERGMIRFRSDLTFALGSADVRDQASQSLRQLARVLNSDAAGPYEVRIVGHTDNVPIGNPSTREKHPTNWHLSAHRAIAVKDVLEEAGVAAPRMGVVGHAFHRPLVPHESGGTEANRRVEIFLVRMTDETVGGSNRGSSASDTEWNASDSAAEEDPAAFK